MSDKTPLGLDPIDAELIADLREQAERMRRGMRLFDSLPIDMQERIVHEIQKQEIADIVEAKQTRRSTT